MLGTVLLDLTRLYYLWIISSWPGPLVLGWSISLEDLPRSLQLSGGRERPSINSVSVVESSALFPILGFFQDRKSVLCGQLKRTTVH